MEEQQSSVRPHLDTGEEKRIIMIRMLIKIRIITESIVLTVLLSGGSVIQSTDYI